MPDWVKSAIDIWMRAVPLTKGRLFRCVTRQGSTWGDGNTEKVIWHIVKDYAAMAGITIFRIYLAPVKQR